MRLCVSVHRRVLVRLCVVSVRLCVSVRLHLRRTFCRCLAVCLDRPTRTYYLFGPFWTFHNIPLRSVKRVFRLALHRRPMVNTSSCS
ncbi:hypothetical protein OV320_8580 [Actinobacteria bacterium OV320]|nr:hypothetical protein OV320_8580 [Actinobacteria bacterium OV320]